MLFDSDCSRASAVRTRRIGRAFVSHTTLPAADGTVRYTLRLCIGSPATTERHVRETWQSFSGA